MRDSVETEFQYYDMPLKMVTSLKCLRRILMASDDNFPEVVGNLKKVRKSWDHLSRIMLGEGSIRRALGMFLSHLCRRF